MSGTKKEFGNRFQIVSTDFRMTIVPQCLRLIAILLHSVKYARFVMMSLGRVADLSARRSLPEIGEASLNQPLDDGENHRGRYSEHEHSIRRLKRSQQSPSWRHNQIAVA